MAVDVADEWSLNVERAVGGVHGWKAGSGNRIASERATVTRRHRSFPNYGILQDESKFEPKIEWKRECGGKEDGG